MCAVRALELGSMARGGCCSAVLMLSFCMTSMVESRAETKRKVTRRRLLSLRSISGQLATLVVELELSMLRTDYEG